MSTIKPATHYYALSKRMTITLSREKEHEQMYSHLPALDLFQQQCSSVNSKLSIAETGKISHGRGSSLILHKYFMQSGRAPRGIL